MQQRYHSLLAIAIVVFMVLGAPFIGSGRSEAAIGSCFSYPKYIRARDDWVFFRPQGASAKIRVNSVSIGCGAFSGSWAWAAILFDGGGWVSSGYNVSTSNSNPKAVGEWYLDDNTYEQSYSENWLGGDWVFSVELVDGVWEMKYGSTELLAFDPSSYGGYDTDPNEVHYGEEITHSAEHFLGSESNPTLFRDLKYKETDGSWTYHTNSGMAFSITWEDGDYVIQGTNGFDAYDLRN